MKKLLSLPPNLVDGFHDITGLPENEWFCTNDPVERKLGSGGGTTWLMRQCHEKWSNGLSFDEWKVAGICASRQDSNAHPCFPMGERAEIVAEPVAIADTLV